MNEQTKAGAVLLPCPFCGKEATLCAERSRDNNGMYPFGTSYVECSDRDCGAQLGGFNSRDDAIGAWNTRPTPQPPPEQAGSVPEGFVLVPKVATNEMALAALKISLGRHVQLNGVDIWAAMLSAAPAPKETP